MIRSRRFAAASAVLLLAALPAAAQFPIRASGCAWQQGYHLPGLATERQGAAVTRTTVTSAAIFNDGGGPALFAGGSFMTADDKLVSFLAKWTGSEWRAVPGSNDERGPVLAMTAFDDGTGTALYVSREAGFDRWNGTTWTTIPFVSGVRSFAAGNLGSGTALYAGGTFKNAGGTVLSHVARWNGLSFTPVGNSTEVNASALAIWNDGGGNRLYAGGTFDTVGGATFNHLAKWTGSAWAPVGGGTHFQGNVGALLAFGTKLYVGGGFNSVGGGVAGTTGIAAWNGGSWESLGGGLADEFGGVDALIVHNDGGGNAVYAGGTFSTSGGAPASFLAKWNGSSWAAVGAGVDGIVGGLLSVAGSGLLAAGTFTQAGGAEANNLARFGGGLWSPYTAKPNGAGLEGDVNHLAVHDDGSGPALYASGAFHVPGATGFTVLAKFDGTAWTPLATSGSQGRWALASFDAGDGPALYVSGGTGTTVPVFFISRLENGAWTALSGGFPRIHDLLPFDDGGGAKLYFAAVATGNSPFLTAIARYDGSSWSAVGAGLEGTVRTLAIFDDGHGSALYAGGNIPETGGGTPIGHLAKWDGAAWTAVGGGLNDEVVELAAWNGALYAAGRFTLAGGMPAQGLARWDGTAWTQVGGGIATGGSVTDLAVFDDGAGSALYVAGFFGENGAPSSSHLGRWDGAAWSTAGAGASGKLQVYDDGSGDALYVAGGFLEAGGVPSYKIAQFCRPAVFGDGFESGFTDAWSQTLP